MDPGDPSSTLGAASKGGAGRPFATALFANPPTAVFARSKVIRLDAPDTQTISAPVEHAVQLVCPVDTDIIRALGHDCKHAHTQRYGTRSVQRGGVLSDDGNTVVVLQRHQRHLSYHVPPKRSPTHWARLVDVHPPYYAWRVERVATRCNLCSTERLETHRA